MACEMCNIPVGTEFTFETRSFAGCNDCNADLLSFSPQKGTHEGKDSIGRHITKLTNPFHCPGCNRSIVFWYSDCGNDGATMDLLEALTIDLNISQESELPIKSE